MSRRLEERTVEPEGACPADLLAYIPALRRYATMLAGNRTAADDIVQEALTRAIEHLDRFKPGTNLRAWLIAIVRNFYLNAYARRRRERAWSSAEEELALTPSIMASQADRVALNELWSALDSLPAEQREVILLVAVEGLSYEEAAAVMRVPIGTIRSRLNRARAKLLCLSGES